MLTLPNENDTLSVGVSSPPLAPLQLMLSTYTSSNSYLMKSSALAPAALFSVTDALAKWSPLQQAWNRIGLATSLRFMMLKLLTDTLPPPPPPPPAPIVEGLAAPQLNDRISICLSKPLRVASPFTPSILRNASKAIRGISPPGLYECTAHVLPAGRTSAHLTGAGNSATNRMDTLSSSSWKCGRRNAMARYTPGFRGSSCTSTRASFSGRLALTDIAASSLATT